MRMTLGQCRVRRARAVCVDAACSRICIRTDYLLVTGYSRSRSLWALCAIPDPQHTGQQSLAAFCQMTSKYCSIKQNKMLMYNPVRRHHERYMLQCGEPPVDTRKAACSPTMRAKSFVGLDQHADVHSNTLPGSSMIAAPAQTTRTATQALAQFNHHSEPCYNVADLMRSYSSCQGTSPVSQHCIESVDAGKLLTTKAAQAIVRLSWMKSSDVHAGR